MDLDAWLDENKNDNGTRVEMNDDDGFLKEDDHEPVEHDLDVHGVGCYRTFAGPSCEGDVFVPYRTAAEWSAYRSNLPSCVTGFLCADDPR